MKHTMSRSWSAIGVGFALTLLTSIPLGAQTTATFNLTGVNGESLAGIYTSPYLGNVVTGGVSTGTIPVICDDFSDNSYNPESWTAYVTDLSNVPQTGNDSTLEMGVALFLGRYRQDGASWTDNESVMRHTQWRRIWYSKVLNSNTAQQQEDYSFALWELFDANGTIPYPGGTLNWGAAVGFCSELAKTSLQADLTNATNDVVAAINAVEASGPSPLNGYQVTIYSYDGPGGPIGKHGLGPPRAVVDHMPPPPQEFISLTSSPSTTYTTPVPEPSSLAVLGVYSLFGAGGFAFLGTPPQSQRWQLSLTVPQSLFSQLNRGKR